MAKAITDPKVIEELKATLLERRQSLLLKLDTWEDRSTPSGLREMGDIADIASVINEEALSSVLTENEIELLNLIENALQKMDNGTYGICEGTNKKIPIARLKAIPWTPYTVEYAEKATKNRLKPNNSNDLSMYNISSDQMDSDYME